MTFPRAIPDALQFADDTLRGFKRKSDHNKSESLACFALVVVCSLVSPLFVTLGEGAFLGKIVPSVLSLSAAASTAWLQLRKPQSLWSLYRDCQRRIEDHVYKYQYHLGPYATDDTERSRLLADAVRAVAWDAHQRWLPLVPTPEAVGTKPAATKVENDPAANA
ncbi:DUF4231 domain-containing protein [Polaromonas sp. P5_D5]